MNSKKICCQRKDWHSEICLLLFFLLVVSKRTRSLKEIDNVVRRIDRIASNYFCCFSSRDCRSSSSFSAFEEMDVEIYIGWQWRRVGFPWFHLSDDSFLKIFLFIIVNTSFLRSIQAKKQLGKILLTRFEHKPETVDMTCQFDHTHMTFFFLPLLFASHSKIERREEEKKFIEGKWVVH